MNELLKTKNIKQCISKMKVEKSGAKKVYYSELLPLLEEVIELRNQSVIAKKLQSKLETAVAKLKIAVKAIKDIDKGKEPVGNIIERALAQINSESKGEE